MLSGGFTSLSVAMNATLGFAAVATANGTPVALGASGTTLNRVDGLDTGDAIEVSDGVLTERVKLQSVNALTRAVTWAPALVGAFNLLNTRFRNLEFDVTIFYGGTDADNQVETWPALSMEPDVPNYAVAVLNDTLTGST